MIEAHFAGDALMMVGEVVVGEEIPGICCPGYIFSVTLVFEESSVWGFCDNPDHRCVDCDSSDGPCAYCGVRYYNHEDIGEFIASRKTEVVDEI